MDHLTLLDLPLEILLPIFNYSDNLKIKQICQYSKYILKNNPCKIYDNILKSNVKKSELGKIPTNVIQKVSDHIEIISDLILRFEEKNAHKDRLSGNGMFGVGGWGGFIRGFMVNPNRYGIVFFDQLAGL